jgi:hypothetical protein
MYNLESDQFKHCISCAYTELNEWFMAKVLTFTIWQNNCHEFFFMVLILLYYEYETHKYYTKFRPAQLKFYYVC